MTEYTPAWLVFNEYFHVRVPAMYANMNQKAMIGSIQYDNEQMAEQAAQEMVHKQYTIAQLAVLSSKGAQIILSNPKDAIRMYRLIQDHLRNLNAHYQRTMSYGKVPISDIQKLDDFAAAVYSIVREVEAVDSRGSHGEVMMRNVQANRLFGRRRMRDNVPKEKQIQEHRPITSDIQQTIIDRNLEYD